MKRSTNKQKAFLAAFRIHGQIGKAAKAAKVDRCMHYDWLKDPDYREAFEQAKIEASDLLVDEAKRRAHEGVFEPLVWQGQFTYPVNGYEKNKDGTYKVDSNNRRIPIYGKKPLGVIKHSDSLLSLLLKGLKPEIFRDRVTAELTGKDGGPISLEAQRLKSLTDDELNQLIAIAAKLAAPAPTGSGGTPAPAE